MNVKQDNFDNSPEERHKIFFQLYANYQNRLLGYLYMMLHNENDAEDILQETAATLWEQFDTFEPGTNFSAWATRIARNKALNFLKKNSRSRVHFGDDFYDRISVIEVEDDQALSERSQALKKCLKKLSKTDMELLSVRYIKGSPMKTIAETFGRSKTGIYHSMARIHNLLHSCIERSLQS